MTLRHCIALLLLTAILAQCTPEDLEDPALVETRTARAIQTVISGGSRLVETKAAELKKTAEAKVATETARLLNARWEIGLDPGHGWRSESGAAANGMMERDVTLDIALRTEAILKERGYRVVLSRRGDVPDQDNQVAAIMNKESPDVVVSIHTNAGGGTGCEACYTVGKKTDAKSRQLSQLLTESLQAKFGYQNRGIFPENDGGRCARKKQTGWNKLYIHDIDAPAALVETAFIDTEGDAKLLKNSRQQFAEAIADAIGAYVRKQ